MLLNITYLCPCIHIWHILQWWAFVDSSLLVYAHTLCTHIYQGSRSYKIWPTAMMDVHLLFQNSQFNTRREDVGKGCGILVLPLPVAFAWKFRMPFHRIHFVHILRLLQSLKTHLFEAFVISWHAWFMLPHFCIHFYQGSRSYQVI